MSEAGRPRWRCCRLAASSIADRFASGATRWTRRSLPISAALTDEEVMVAADIGNDRLVHLVAPDANRSAIDDAAKRQHRHLGRPASDIYDHRSRRLGHRKTGTDRCRHRLLD